MAFYRRRSQRARRPVRRQSRRKFMRRAVKRSWINQRVQTRARLTAFAEIVSDVTGVVYMMLPRRDHQIGPTMSGVSSYTAPIDMTSYNNLFESYTVRKISLRWVPRNPLNTGSTNLGSMWLYVDPNSEPTPNRTGALESEKSFFMNPSLPWRKVVPGPSLKKVYNAFVNTGGSSSGLVGDYGSLCLFGEGYSGSSTIGSFVS